MSVGVSLLSLSEARGQAEVPKFEVTSVKRWVPGSAIHLFECSGNHFHAAGPMFANSFMWAYKLPKGTARREGVFSRAPDKLLETPFEIEAVAAAPFTSEGECRLMLQALIEDRFKVVTHLEDREGDVLELVVAPGGSKLKRALPTDEGTDIHIVQNGMTRSITPQIDDPEERARTKGLTMDELAYFLPTTAALPMVNKTGIEGRYKIDIRYSTTLPVEQRDAPSDPLLGVALAELGLRVEKRKGVNRIRVLDHVEWPDEN